MVEIESPLPGAAFPRPTSLYMPERFTEAIVDSSSYTPFPAFPGSGDPFGLNTFLLHPDDGMWKYGRAGSSQSEQSTGRPTLIRGRNLRRQTSLGALRQPSPLAQPPISAEGHSPRQRKRSNSLDSPLATATTLPADPDVMPPQKVMSASGKSSLRRAITFARKSVFRTPNPSTDALGLIPGGTPTRPSEEGPETPLSTRSKLESSASSVSSTSSSEGVRTPSESMLEVRVVGVDLTDALEVGAQRRGWRGWVGGRRTSRTASSSATSPITTSSITSSRSSSLTTSPNPSTINLEVQRPARTPSPSVTVTSPQLGPAPTHSWVGEQLRRSSLRKMATLRRPSPHPLALHLRRLNSQLPGEVAFTLQAGQKVFPKSVNPPSLSLGPAEGGLRTSLAIRSVLVHLDAGHLPTGTISPRQLTSDSGPIRARGIGDFINRPPFEDRMMVFFPNGTFSPISMARPGFGVWDLDFSPHIVALSEVDELSASMPRSSLSVEETTDSIAQGEKEVLQPPPQGSPVEETILTPPLIETPANPRIVSLPSMSPLPKAAHPPVSSFRQPRPAQGSWESSDSESDEENGEENEPLARVARRSVSFSQQIHSAPSALQIIAKLQASSSTSQLPHPSPARFVPPVNKARRVSYSTKDAEEAMQKLAMDEVARARERRQAANSGEVERRAMAEQRRAEEAKRRSVVPMARSTSGLPPPRSTPDDQPTRRSRDSATSSLSLSSTYAQPATFQPPSTERRRTRSTVEPAFPSAPQRPQESRRYHSFYEAQAHGHAQAASLLVQPQLMPPPMSPPMMTSPSMMYLQPQITGYVHPAMAFPPMPSRGSMIFPPQQMYALPSAGSHASLAIPDQRKARRSSRIA